MDYNQPNMSSPAPTPAIDPAPSRFWQKAVRWFLLATVLVVVAFISMLTAMGFAIHGREVKVPKVIGFTPEAAANMLNDRGLLIEVQDRFYSPDVAEGKVMSQS